MIGVFDSGMGGIFALCELRRLLNRADIVFLADKENAPYGTKSESELLSIVIRDIEKLLNFGADKILMACCTASTVYDKLPELYRKVSVPIIEPTSERAVRVSKSGKIGVISTEATRKNGAFEKFIIKKNPHAEVKSLSCPELVTLAEEGRCDENLSHTDKQIIEKTVAPLKFCGIDTLILGCTHFAYFEREIQNILKVNTVNSARIGAEIISRFADNSESGRTFYI